MDTSEYVAFLWRIIVAEGVIIGALVGTVWRHIVIDRRRDIDLQRCKDALGLNGR